MTDEVFNLLNSSLVVINLGVDKFAKTMEDQKVEVMRVDRHPPAGSDQEIINLLEQLI